MRVGKMGQKRMSARAFHHRDIRCLRPVLFCVCDITALGKNPDNGTLKIGISVEFLSHKNAPKPGVKSKTENVEMLYVGSDE